jgi:hypothetical protein
MSKKNKHKANHNHNPPVADAPVSPAPSAPTAPVAEAPGSPVSPPGSPESPQYEFSDAQNRVINDLAQAIVWVRVPMLITGLFQAIIATGLVFRLPKDGAHIVGIIGHTLAALVCFVLAGWLHRAANAFTLITTTKGRDISHLMTALRNLDGWFDMLAFFVKLYLFLLGVLIVVLMVGLLAGAFKEPG